MCSIIAWNGKFHEEVVLNICRNSRIRGLHSFGYCYPQGGGGLQVKKFLNYFDFTSSLLEDQPEKFIAHFRYSTSGDYENEQNNQPIQRDNTALVFNGVIDMGTKKSMEIKHNVDLISDNDGELALIFKPQLQAFLKGKSFAGVFMDQEGKIEAYRNLNRPCHVGNYKGAKILASTKDILLRSGVEDTKPLKQNQFVEI